MYMHNNHCHRVIARLQFIIIIIIIIIIVNLYPFSVHVVTFNFITNLMHLFN